MNVIIFPRARARFAYVHYLDSWSKIGTFLGLFALSVILLGSGYLLGMFFGHKIILSEWKADVIAQKERLDLAKQESQAAIDALMARTDSLQTHLSHIDALANMLVSEVDLDTEEFTFDSTLAMGGPHMSFKNDMQPDMKVDVVLEKFSTELEEREHQLQVLNDLLTAKRFARETYPQGWPIVHGWISSYFGKRRSPFTNEIEMHKGIDFAGKLGSDVVAVGGGIVTQAAVNGNYGYVVEIDHGNGYMTRYGHNETILVKAGELVERGQVIAKLGNTGRSTGPHVHFEVLKEGVRVDPIKFIQ